MICQFIKQQDNTCICLKCKRVLKHINCEHGVSECISKCKHLQEIKGTIKTDCKTCNGKFMYVKVFSCELHNRCVPTFNPQGKALEEWNSRKPESNIYTLCSQCPDFKTSEKLI